MFGFDLNLRVMRTRFQIRSKLDLRDALERLSGQVLGHNVSEDFWDVFRCWKDLVQWRRLVLID